MNDKYYGIGFIDDCNSCCDVGFWCDDHSTKIDQALKFVTNNKNPICLCDGNGCHTIYDNKLAKSLLVSIQSVTLEDILKKIDESNPVIDIPSIPLFNSIYDASKGMIEYLMPIGTSNYVDTGAYFTSELNNIEAKRKYGEEHIKLACQLGFTQMSLMKQPRTVSITPFGIECSCLGWDEINDLLTKLIFRIPVISYLIKTAKYDAVSIRETLRSIGMKESTVIRRGSSVKLLIHVLDGTHNKQIYERLSKIYW